MAIRALRANDVEHLAELVAQLGDAIPPAELTRRLAGIMGPGHGSWVYEDDDGALLGWLHAQERPSLLTESTAEITAVVVAAKARRRGCGRALMAEAERWAAERGCASVALRSRVDRDKAHRFYEALGYAVRSTSLKLVKALPPFARDLR